jgi:hypothetical protein
MHPDLCYPTPGHSSNMQDIYWPDLLSHSRIMSPMDRCCSADFELTPLSQSIVGHESNVYPPSTSNSYIRIQDHDLNDSLATSPLSPIRRLASLSVSLSECVEKLPSMAGNGMCGSRKTRILAVDELFRLTTEFIDVMRCISVVECETSPTLSTIDPKQLSAQLPLAIHSKQLSHSEHQFTTNGLGRSPGPFSHVDEATVSMVFACHSRLMEIYTSIFHMMQACIEHSLAPQLGQDWAVVLPRLEVGSLSSPPVRVDANTPLKSATATSMYMLIITMLSSQLWEKLKDLMRAGSGASTASTSELRSTLKETMWSTMIERTDRLLQTMEATNHLLNWHSG